MGSKSAAKRIMEAAKVPLVPGYHGEAQDSTLLAREAAKIGYPVLIKATAGGGGKGMKVASAAGEFSAALASAQREAKSAFGDERVLVEKYLTSPRHIEIQVFADTHGNAVYLFGRPACSPNIVAPWARQPSPPRARSATSAPGPSSSSPPTRSRRTARSSSWK
jgi:3-methylcrotonyl-CoA carboxylase alpha subunit